MLVVECGIPRRDVIAFYVTYDRAKKPGAVDPPLEEWPWTSCGDLDRALEGNKLKWGCMTAYRTWSLVQLGHEDLLDCAVDRGTAFRSFNVEVQSLRELVRRGLIDGWEPKGAPDNAPSWWQPLRGGAGLPRDAALILRPATVGEAPAKWYVEDGTGRVLALVQGARNLVRERIVFAYVGEAAATDEQSEWLKTRPELRER
jgi:hypothetical protein